MSGPSFMAIHLVDEIFHRISSNFDLPVTLEETSGDHQSYYNSSFGHHGYLYQISSM